MTTLFNPAFDPLKIFQHATNFHESDHRLRNSAQHDKPDDVAFIAHPSMVLSAFAIELYFKCLLCVETGKVPSGHHLKRLFDGLALPTRRRLEDLWDADIRRPERQRILDHIRTLPNGRSLRLDLPYALNVGANSFVELRYFYERQQTFFLLGDFPNLLRQVILERFPSWAMTRAVPPKGLVV